MIALVALNWARQKAVSGEGFGDLGWRGAPMKMPAPEERCGEKGRHVVDDIADLGEAPRNRVESPGHAFTVTFQLRSAVSIARPLTSSQCRRT